ncbi:MAG TPA: amidohydrolase family protein [Steroidobacteraceae bacterium]
MNKLSIAFALALVGLTSNVSAADFLIRNAEVHTLTSAGKLTNADVLVSDGKIAAVGRGLSAPAGATIVEANGKSVTPGLFAGLTAIGVEEVSGESSTVDENLRLNAPAHEMQWRPEFDVTLAYNPRSVLVPIAQVEGLTWTVIEPGTPAGGSMLAGQGAAVALDGRFDAVLEGSRSMFVSIGSDVLPLTGGSRAAQYMLLDQAVREARGTAPLGDRALLLPAGREVLARYLKGGRFVFNVHRAADIRQVLALSKRYGIRPVIAGGAEAWVVAEELAAAEVPVLLDSLVNLPITFDVIGARLDNAALLARAGVRVGFTQVLSDRSHNARKIRQVAGNAVAHGLPWDLALAGLTSVPAEIFGLSQTRGRIAEGQVADLVLWSGDPLEVTTVAEQVWIGGNAISMRSRQTELRDRYLEKLRRGAAR